jgi:hypothetical protein
MRLTDDDVDRLATRIVELIGPLEPNHPRLVDVSTVARTLSVSEKFVRKHAIELGGRQLVPGGPWRYDLAKALGAGQAPLPSPPQPGPTTRRTRPAVRSRPDGAPLLPVRGLR